MSLAARIDRALAGCAADRRRQREEQIARGAKQELREHRATLKRAKRLTPAKIAEGIARDHVKKDPQHYQQTTKQRGLKAPRVALIGRRGKVRIYRVDDTKVRKIFPDWTMGGHDIGYDFIPHHEVWIAGELGPPRPPLEELLTQIHELRERRRMIVLMHENKTQSEAYEIAHNESLEVEDYYRKRNGRGLKRALQKEQGQ